MDNYSSAAFPVWLYFDDVPLGHATGFLWNHASGTYLVTNWHVVSGRNWTTLQTIHGQGARPNKLVYLRWKGVSLNQAVTVSLYDEELPVWLVHPAHGRQVDVVAIPVEAPAERQRNRPINTYPQTPLWVAIGGDVFILGFPFLPSRRFVENIPTWKRGTIASEPELAVAAYHMLVDTASRPGMSGAPVIMRVHGRAPVETGEDIWEMKDLHIPSTRVVGVYSGRRFTRSPEDAQLGIVWPISYLDEIVAGQTRDLPPDEQELRETGNLHRICGTDAEGETWCVEVGSAEFIERASEMLRKVGCAEVTVEDVRK